MKLRKTGFALLAVVLSVGALAPAAHAQKSAAPPMAAPPTATNPQVIAVINRADWCAVCKANGPRVMGMIPTYAGQAIAFVTNDLTNDDTKAASQVTLTRLGVATAVAALNQTGIIALVDARTHKLIKTVSVKESRLVATVLTIDLWGCNLLARA